MTRLRWVLQLPYALPAAAYAVVCLALWPLPVFGLLHVKSSAVIAGAAFFGAGLGSLALFRRDDELGTVLIRQAALLAVPLLLLTVTLIWRPNCGYPLGLLLFVVFTVPSVVLGVALAYLLDAADIRRRNLWFSVTGVLLATLPVAYDLGLHPQLFTYNHVWGGILGPLYDEELAIRPGLFFFRALTVWWAIALVLIGQRSTLRRQPEGGEVSRRRGIELLAVCMIIAATYLAAPWLGINTPAWYIQDRLGGHLELDRFDIYYDPESTSEGELRIVQDVHRYRYRQLATELGADVPYRIATYLYPDPETKAALTGSRTTSVVPTWLPVPQIHMLHERFEGSFAHELAHVIAREFGMPVIRASPAVGLVEGLAVAVEPPDGLPTLHAQVSAALLLRDELGVYRDSLAESIADQLRPFGFWTGRGAVGYITMGSFVRYLLDAYGPETLQEAYRSGRIEQSFGKSVDVLAQEWERYVRRYPEDREAIALVRARFSQPSLFERRCPHHVPHVVRHLRTGREALARGEVDRAILAFESALRASPANEQALAAWSAIELAGGGIEEARARLERAAELSGSGAGVTLLTRLGDARRLTGDDAAADSAYAAALNRLPAFARGQRAMLALRSAAPPETIRLLLDPSPVAERAVLLEEAPLGSAFAGHLWAGLGEFERAERLLAAASDRLPPAQAQSWRSQFLHAAGHRTRAASLAEAAAVAFERDGEHAAAARERDRATLLSWILVRETPNADPNVSN